MNRNPYYTDYSNTIVVGDIVYSSDLKTVISSKKDITYLNLVRGVRCIGRYAFADCKDLTIVRIPETVIFIDDFAFQNCTAIQELHLPFDMEYISLFAFTTINNTDQGFFLKIPQIFLPKETYFKYLKLLPQYIFDYDHEDYGYSDEEFEQFSKSENLEDGSFIPDTYEFCRIVTKYLLALNGFKGTCPEEVLPNNSISHDVQRSVVLELLHNNSLINRHQLIDMRDIPFADRMPESIPDLIRKCVREWLTWDSSNTPIDTCENIIEYALTMGLVPMIIWNKTEIAENSQKDFVRMINDKYGEYPLASIREAKKNKSFLDWLDKLEAFNASSVFFSVSMEYKRKGYKTNPSLIYDILYTSMMVAFQIGYCFGMRMKKNHIGIVEGELFSEEEMKGGVKTDYFEKKEEYYLSGMRLISQLDNRQFDVLALECYKAASDHKEAYFLRSVPGNFLDSAQFNCLNECVGIRHFFNYNLYSNNKPHVTFSGPYEKARKDFLKEIECGNYKFTKWPNLSDSNDWGRMVPDTIYY